MSGLTVALEHMQSLLAFADKTEGKTILATVHVLDIMDTCGFEVFVRTLEMMDTPESLKLSRLVGGCLCRAAINLTTGITSVSAEAHELINAFNTAIVNDRPTLDLMWQAIKFSEYGYCSRDRADNSFYFSVSGLRDIFIPCDFDPDENFTEEMLLNEASSVARRGYEVLMEVLARTTPEFKAAAEVAQAAFDGERQWHEGIGTEFNLIQRPIWDILDKLLLNIENNPEFCARLNQVCRTACTEVLMDPS